MHRILLPILLIFILSNCDTGDTPMIINHEIDVSELIVAPKSYIIYKASEAPLIDGLDNDTCWKHISFTDPFTDISTDISPAYETKCKMTWDDQYLYIYAWLEEEHIWGNITERDEIIYRNNDFEVFIDPGGKGAPYAEIEINALGTVWDLLLNKSYRLGGQPISEWDIKDFKSAVNINGTLNDPSDQDTSWSVEMAIPLQSIASLKDRRYPIPKDGSHWRMNFSRVHWDHDLVDGKYQRKHVDGKLLAEYNWVWSKQKVINMHEPEKWAYVQFSNKQPGEIEVFKEDPDQTMKQVIYALFRMALAKNLLPTDDMHVGKSAILLVKYKQDSHFIATYTQTRSGFEVDCKDPKSKHSYVIDHQARLKKLK